MVTGCLKTMARPNLSRILNLLLIVLLVVGISFWFAKLSTYRILNHEYAKLATTFGTFSGSNPSTPMVIPVATGDNMVFRWRVYLPAGYYASIGDNARLIARRQTQLGMQLPCDYPTEFLVTQKFEVIEEKELPRLRSLFSDEERTSRRIERHVAQRLVSRTWAANHSGPVKCELGGGNGSPFVRSSEFFVDKWDELEFETLEGDVHDLTPEHGTALLTIRLPEHLVDEAPRWFTKKDADPNELMKLILSVENRGIPQ